MKYKKTVTLTEEEKNNIEMLLNIDDISEVDEQTRDSLNACEDDSRIIASFNFENGAWAVIALCSGSMNYWLDCTLETQEGAHIDCEPADCLSNFDIGCGSNKYEICFETV